MASRHTSMMRNIWRPPGSTRLPYTTLFRSALVRGRIRRRGGRGVGPARRPEAELAGGAGPTPRRSEEHTPELQSRLQLVRRLLVEKKKDLRQQRLAQHPHRRFVTCQINLNG